MWPSQRLASNDLESAGQGEAQARRRDRRGIRPIVTLLEERFLLSTPGTIQIAPDTSPGGNNAVIVNIITDSNASGQPVTVNEGVYACPFNIIDTNGVTHTDDALSVDLNFELGTGYTPVQPMAVSLSSVMSPTWHQNSNAGVGNQLAWLEQYAFANAKNQPGGATADQFAALQIEAWKIIDPNFTWTYSGGGDGAVGGDEAVVTADVNALQILLTAGPGSPSGPSASFVGTPNYGPGMAYQGTLLSLDPGVGGSQYQNLIMPATDNLGDIPTINVSAYYANYTAHSHTATAIVTAADGTDLSQYLDLSKTIHTDAGTYTDTWTFDGTAAGYPVEHGVVTDHILPAMTSVTAYPTWYVYGNNMTFNSNTGPVYNTGPGTVEFRDTTNFVMPVDLGGGPATNGHATFQTSTLRSGVHIITATYYRDDGSPLSSGQIIIDIAKS